MILSPADADVGRWRQGTLVAVGDAMAHGLSH